MDRPMCVGSAQPDVDQEPVILCSFGPICSTQLNESSSMFDMNKEYSMRSSQYEPILELPCLRPVTGYIIGEMTTRSVE